MNTNSYGARKTFVLLVLVTIVLLSGAGQGVQGQQWTGPDASNNIWNPNPGNVGIGTTAPNALLDLASSNQFSNRIRLSGQEYYAAGNTSTHGIDIRLGLNRTNERQIWFADSAQAVNSTNAQVRIRLAGSYGALDSLSTDGTTVLPLSLNTFGGNVGIGTAIPLGRFHLVVPSYTDTSIPVWDNHFLVVGADSNTGGISLSYNQTTNTGYLMSLSPNVAWRNTVIQPFGGNVGIGTTTPASNLQIGTQTQAPSANPTALSLGGSYSNSAGANLKLKLYDDGVAANTYGIGVSLGSMDFGVSPTAGYHWYSGGANKMTLTSNGDLSVSGSIAAKYQDLAEWVPSSEQLSAGTVVVLDTTKSNQVISSGTAYDTRVAGVISAQPGITLGESGEGKVLVATTGRVRVKVDASRGPIQIGDLLVTSDVSGVAMKSEPVEFAGRKMHMPGTIIGKALEPLAKGSGEILVLLSLQ